MTELCTRATPGLVPAFRARKTLRAALAALVAVTGSGLVVLASPAPALALTDPGRLGFTSSVLDRSLTGASTAQRVAATSTATAAGTGTRLPVSSGALGLSRGAAAVAGPVGVAAQGLFIGWTLGAEGMRFAGFDSNGAALELLGLGPDPTYLPNFDASDKVIDEGWSGNPQVALRWQGCGPGTGCDGNTESPLTATPLDLDGLTYGDRSGALVATLSGGMGINPLGQRARLLPSTANPNLPYLNAYCQAGTTTGRPNWWQAAGSGGFTSQAVVGPGESGAASPGAFICETANGYNGWTDQIGLDRVELNLGGDVLATWYPIGNPDRPDPIPADPYRFWEMRTSCSDGTSNTTESATYRESDPEWPTPPAASCPAGAVVSGWELWQIVPDFPELSFRFDVGDVADLVGGLGPALAGDAELDLFRRIGTDLFSCFDAPDLCLDWRTSPTADTDYECQYAGTAVALSECNAYAPTFNNKAGRPVTDPVTKRSVTATPYGDPKTGGVPTADVGPGPGDPDGSSCESPSASDVLSPSFFLSGLICLFVPTLDLGATFAPVGAALAGAPPFSWWTELQDGLFPPGFDGTGASLPGGVGVPGCPSWVVHVGEYAQNVVCESSYTTALVGLRPVLAAMLLLLAFFPLLRSVWYSLIPFIRPIPVSNS